MKRLTTFIAFFFSAISIFSQSGNFSLKQAIALGLENNYSIQLVENQSEIAHNNNHPGRAGFLPKLSFNSGITFSNNNINQSYASGLEVKKNNVASSNLNASVALNWTLFDGMRMFVARDRLNELDFAGEMNLRITVENTVLQIITAYCDVVRHKQLINSMQTNLNISLERQKIAELKMDVGTGSKGEVLQAKVDGNAQRSAIIREEQALLESKNKLNVLLARDPLTEFEVEDSVERTTHESFEELQHRFENNNSNLKMLALNTRLAELNVKDIRGQRMPLVSFNSSYGYSRASNAAGFVLLNQNTGLNYGLTLSIPIFSGFNSSRDYQNAKLNLDNSILQQRDSTNRMNGTLQVAWRQYQNDLRLLSLEEENSQLAQENLDLALERFRLGAIDVLILKDAQRSYEDAMVRVVNARYNSMISETKLRKLDGTLSI